MDQYALSWIDFIPIDGKKEKKNCDETGENALTKIGRSSTGYYQL